MIGSLFKWSVVLIIGAFISPFSCTSFHEYPNPVSKDSKLFGREYSIIHNLLHFAESHQPVDVYFIILVFGIVARFGWPLSRTNAHSIILLVVLDVWRL